MEVGETFGTGLPAPSEGPPRLNFAQKEQCSLHYWPACSVPIGREKSSAGFPESRYLYASGHHVILEVDEKSFKSPR
ncbi:hypothetical protein TNCV_393371 [Trichonephila clavipes]|nr:hypothetical protein TNCV_393371 [Trichonephila clavipes]